MHGIGLIERYRQGNNRPSVIYVKKFCETEQRKARKILCFWNARNWKSTLQGIGNPDCKKLEVRNAKNRSPDFKNLDGSNTKINKTENILKNFIGMLYYQIDIGMW